MGCGTSCGASSATPTHEVVEAQVKALDTSSPSTPNSKVESGLEPEAIKLAPAEEITFKQDVDGNFREQGAAGAEAEAAPPDPQERAFRKVLASAAPEGASQPERLEDALPIQMAPVGVERRPSTIGVGLGDYARLHGEEFAALLRLERQPGWTFKKREADVDIYTCFDEGKGLVSFKGVADIASGDPKTGFLYLIEHFFNPACRAEFDELCISGETIEQFLPFYRVVHFKFKAPAARGIVKDRDAVLLVRFRFEADGAVLVSVFSTVHRGAPESAEFVRVDVPCGGYIVRPAAREGVLQVTYLGVIDPRGWIPTFVKNLAAWKQPLVLAKFKAKYGV